MQRSSPSCTVDSMDFAWALGARAPGRMCFDTPQSRDHDWGPQVTLLVGEVDYSADLAAEISRMMADELSFEVAGHPAHFAPFAELGATPDGDLIHGGHLAASTRRPIRHKVAITTISLDGWHAATSCSSLLK